MGGSASKKNKQEIDEVVTTTRMTREQVLEMQAHFREHDRDQSGTLDFGEFATLVRLRKPEATDDTLRNLFEYFDEDGSGHVSFKEMCVAFSELTTMTPRERLDFVFDMYDEDGSGFLCQAELKMICTQMMRVAVACGRKMGVAASYIDTIISRIDVNGDNHVTKDEWMARGLQEPALLQLLNAAEDPVHHSKPLPGTASGGCAGAGSASDSGDS